MTKRSWTILAATALAGLLAFGGQPPEYASHWRTSFALLFVASLVSYLYEYAAQSNG